MSDTTWTRYRHRERPEIEYEVELREGWGRPLAAPFNGEPCYRIRTIKNHGHHEEIHQPAFTYMPADKFIELYERVT